MNILSISIFFILLKTIYCGLSTVNKDDDDDVLMIFFSMFFWIKFLLLSL